MPEVNGVLNGQIIVPNLMVNHHTFPFEWYFWDTPCFQTHPYEISRVAKSIAQFIPGGWHPGSTRVYRSKMGYPKADDSVPHSKPTHQRYMDIGHQKWYHVLFLPIIDALNPMALHFSGRIWAAAWWAVPARLRGLRRWWKQGPRRWTIAAGTATLG